MCGVAGVESEEAATSAHLLLVIVLEVKVLLAGAAGLVVGRETKTVRHILSEALSMLCTVAK